MNLADRITGITLRVVAQMKLNRRMNGGVSLAHTMEKIQVPHCAQQAVNVRTKKRSKCIKQIREWT
jgi:hypothetical protein